MLYHFSENPDIPFFEPRLHTHHPHLKPSVWAINEKCSPLYFFPRDCPRIGYYQLPTTSKEDHLKFFSNSSARMIIAVENKWFHKIKEATLCRYHLFEKTFHLHDEGAGYYLSYTRVVPEKVDHMTDLFKKLLTKI
ncbi:hypothetical protein IC621_02060 [Bacillus sp. IB182487]|uniref:Uncharacterized protein n=1 Tax=Metabacillus arenae TaxID=2771434 RepID=A0A926NEJ4_9BACI|nr:DUF6886 family protein [Metabacillus arenae]MBD1379003.1 hypothetical protein [Metabacillus arenae]